ncbi:MAG: immunoglobulin domain-containing protein [Planctomycetes bacterium]|nr:immunoglobulin domain-containing protein [Planctomycetota bacterium]
MLRKFFGFGLFVAVFIAPSNAQLFSFDASTQGWRVYDIPYLGNHAASRAPNGALPALDGTVGLPAPSIRVTDQAGETWIGPPSSVYGPRPDLYGQSFTFDVLYRYTDNAVYASVGIESPTMSLWASEPPPVLNVWLRRSYVFAPGVWHVTTVNGALATPAEIHSVLSDLTGVYIHTEWRTGPDDTSVDNIAIGNVHATCPTVTVHPESTGACAAASVSFTVAADGTGPLAYAWRHNSVPIGSEANPTAASQTLVLNELTAADTGDYDCIVSNSCGPATSRAASLTVCACLACSADFNQDGGVDGTDVQAFFAAWEVGGCDGDVNSDGGVDGADVDTFFAAWEAGGC